MFNGEFGAPHIRGSREDDDSNGELRGFRVEEIIGTEGKNLLFASSPLVPSRPGCAGDHGTVGDVRVLDVVEEPGGLLHIMETSTGLHAGSLAMVRRDIVRRDRLKGSHAAAVACQARLADLRIPVVSIEIVPGIVWIEVGSPVPALALSPLVDGELPIEIATRASGRMTVYLDGQMVKTVDAPIAVSTAAISGAAVRRVAALSG